MKVILEIFDDSWRIVLEVIDGWREQGHQAEPYLLNSGDSFCKTGINRRILPLPVY